VIAILHGLIIKKSACYELYLNQNLIGEKNSYNILRWIGLIGLLGEQSPVRHPAKRRRIKTVIRALIDNEKNWLCLSAYMLFGRSIGATKGGLKTQFASTLLFGLGYPSFTQPPDFRFTADLLRKTPGGHSK
jgi:hypothetical protein